MGLFPAARRLRIWLDHHTARGRRHHRELRELYARFVRPGDLCFDVGANVGDRTEIFLELGARVVAVEPQADCAAVLRRRFRRRPGLTVVAAAVGDHAGTAEFFVCDYNPGLATLSKAWTERGRFAGEFEWNRKVTVPLTTLDALIAAHGLPRFCKIDVEGYEESVFRGLSRPLPQLCFEFHGELIEEARRCMARLEAIGPAAFNCTLNDAPALAFDRWMPADALLRALAGRGDPLIWGDIYARGAPGPGQP
jgi:FkbM family methyltransferase